MDALFNEEYKEAEKKKQNKSKGKNKKKKTTLTKEELQEFDRMWDEMDETCTCEAEEPDGFNLDECECDKAEEYNQYEDDFEDDFEDNEEYEETVEETDEDIDENYKNCYDCINKDCEFNLHGKKWIPDMDIPLFIGGLLADEIMSNVCRNMIHIIEIKDALFSIEDEEIREEALDRVKMVQENLCNTIELIRRAPDTVHEIA